MKRLLSHVMINLSCFCGFLNGVHAAEPSSEASSLPAGHTTYVNHIICHGSVRTSCHDLQKLLGIAPRRSYSEDELNALDLKLGQLGYYSTFRVALDPSPQAGHADLVIALTEKSTARHAVGARLEVRRFNRQTKKAQWSLTPKASYAFSDHNFLGKGYFLHAAVDAQFTRRLPLVSSYNLELDVPLADAWTASLRLVSPAYGFAKDLAFAGLSYQISEAASLTAYAGNMVGGNFTYHTEDNAFIPTSGALFSMTILEDHGFLSHDEGYLWPALEARKSWQVGRFRDRQGVFTIGVGANSMLNPALRSFANPGKNRSLNASGFTYSLVSETAGRRSAYFAGLESFGTDGESFFGIASAGYKAALESMDVSVSLAVLGQRAKP